jgi:hypothetical protein
LSILSAGTKVWLHGLIAAFISAFSTAASGAIALPTVFNFSHDGLLNMIKLSVVPAMLAVFGYLKASPLPGLIEPGDVATVKNPVIGTDGSITGTSATLTKGPQQ